MNTEELLLFSTNHFICVDRLDQHDRRGTIDIVACL